MRTRVKTHSTRLPNGTVVQITKLVQAPELEWVLQAASVRALKAEPGYGDEPAPGVTFTIAGDFNASRRSAQESVKAKATGISAGEQDLRVYGERARLLLIEYKAEKGRLSPEQIKRHALHRFLGYTVVVIKEATPEAAAEQTLSVVRAFLAAGSATQPTDAANDNEQPVAGLRKGVLE